MQDRIFFYVVQLILNMNYFTNNIFGQVKIKENNLVRCAIKVELYIVIRFISLFIYYQLAKTITILVSHKFCTTELNSLAQHCSCKLYYSIIVFNNNIVFSSNVNQSKINISTALWFTRNKSPGWVESQRGAINSIMECRVTLNGPHSTCLPTIISFATAPNSLYSDFARKIKPGEPRIDGRKAVRRMARSLRA